jgi:ribosomal protein S27E
MARPRTWIQEERRKTLGDWIAFCPGCGHVQRYFEELEAGLTADCPQCDEQLRSRCQACGARIASAFAIECEDCGEALRPDEHFGSRIRRYGR